VKRLEGETSRGRTDEGAKCPVTVKVALQFANSAVNPVYSWYLFTLFM